MLMWCIMWCIEFRSFVFIDFYMSATGIPYALIRPSNPQLIQGFSFVLFCFVLLFPLIDIYALSPSGIVLACSIWPSSSSYQFVSTCIKLIARVLFIMGLTTVNNKHNLMMAIICSTKTSQFPTDITSDRSFSKSYAHYCSTKFAHQTLWFSSNLTTPQIPSTNVKN